MFNEIKEIIIYLKKNSFVVNAIEAILLVAAIIAVTTNIPSLSEAIGLKIVEAAGILAAKTAFVIYCILAIITFADILLMISVAYIKGYKGKKNKLADTAGEYTGGILFLSVKILPAATQVVISLFSAFCILCGRNGFVVIASWLFPESYFLIMTACIAEAFIVIYFMQLAKRLQAKIKDYAHAEAYGKKPGHRKSSHRKLEEAMLSDKEAVSKLIRI